MGKWEFFGVSTQESSFGSLATLCISSKFVVSQNVLDLSKVGDSSLLKAPT